MANVMTGVPSIVMGLFIYVVWTLMFGLGLRRRAGPGLPDAAGGDPLHRGDAAPGARRTCARRSYALGTTKSRTIVTVVLPAALPGIVSGCLLAVARAAGETAPLLFTIGAATRGQLEPVRGPEHGAVDADLRQRHSCRSSGAQDRAWGAALTLIVLDLPLHLIARLVTRPLRLKR